MCPKPKSLRSTAYQVKSTSKETSSLPEIPIGEAEQQLTEQAYAYLNQIKNLGLLEHGDCGADPKVKPTWYDEELFLIGRRVGQKYFFSVLFGHLCGLAMLVQIPTILKPLLSTGNSKSIAHCFARYLSTVNHVKLWYDGDVWNPEDPAHESFVQVRKQHKLVSNRLNAGRTPGKDEMALSAYDMFITIWAFIGNSVLHPKETGFPDTNKNMAGFIHFWRVIGYLQGVPDRFNLPADLSLAKEVVRVTWEQEFKPILASRSADDKGRIMCDCIVEATRSVIPPLSAAGFIKYLYEFNHLQSPVECSALVSKVGHQILKTTMSNILPQKTAEAVANFLINRNLVKANKNRDNIREKLKNKGPIIESDQQNLENKTD